MLSRKDKDALIKAAQTDGAELMVVTDARIMPRVKGATVVMQPVILLRYIVRFQEDGSQEKRIWEEYVDDNEGVVNLEGTLFEELQKDEWLGKRMQVVDRTNALLRRQ